VDSFSFDPFGEIFWRKNFLRPGGVLKHMGPIDFLFKTHLGMGAVLGMGHILSLGPETRPQWTARLLSLVHLDYNTTVL
jgi:hypothetical protein